jgi:hypothetical protein
VLFGGGGFAGLGKPVQVACGTADACSGGGTEIAAHGGATFWLTRFLAAEASYLGVRDITLDGSGQGYRFDSTYEMRLMNLLGKIGGPVGPMRLYGQFGATHNRVTLTTVQTMDDRTVTVDEVPTTIPGGTQSFGLITSGWGWSLGGGLEGWLKPAVGLYAEFAYAPIEGADDRGGEGRIDDRAMFLGGGIRVRLGR